MGEVTTNEGLVIIDSEINMRVAAISRMELDVTKGRRLQEKIKDEISELEAQLDLIIDELNEDWPDDDVLNGIERSIESQYELLRKAMKAKAIIMARQKCGDE